MEDSRQKGIRVLCSMRNSPSQILYLQILFPKPLGTFRDFIYPVKQNNPRTAPKSWNHLLWLVLQPHIYVFKVQNWAPVFKLHSSSCDWHTLSHEMNLVIAWEDNCWHKPKPSQGICTGNYAVCVAVYQGFSLIARFSLLTSTKKSILGLEAIWVLIQNTLKPQVLE